MTREEHAQYWVESAEHDLAAAESMFAAGRYDWCLFIGHLVLEKILKALFVLNNEDKIPPKTHNLVKLANLASVNLNREQEIFLDEVNDFNLETRYPDYKFAFYQRCTKEFTEAYFHRIKDQYQWLKSQIK